MVSEVRLQAISEERSSASGTVIRRAAQGTPHNSPAVRLMKNQIEVYTHTDERPPVFSIFSALSQNMSLFIVWRDEADPEVYEEARLRRVFNHRRPKRYPLAIVFVKTEAEIVSAVRLAIAKKCCISLRSGGHSWPAWSVRDDTILVDLGNYSEIALDENTGVVRVSPSMTGMDLNSYLLTKGRVFSVGHCPDVGMGGFLLGGGMGWNCNVCSLLQLHVITGQLIRIKELGLGI